MLDISVEAPWPDSEEQWFELAERACEAIQKFVPELCSARLSVSLLFTDDNQVHSLNKEWRGKDAPTNVLSFPMLSRDELLELSEAGPPEMLGDIALAYETCLREATEKGIPMADHTVHLIVHGLLHLAGYDHEISPQDATIMEGMEIKALALLGIADPYGDHQPAQG